MAEHLVDMICINDASINGGTFTFEEYMISPGSQGVWFGVKGSLTGGTIFLEKEMCSGIWSNVKSYTAVGDAVEVLPVGDKLRIRTQGVTGAPVVEVKNVGGY